MTDLSDLIDNWMNQNGVHRWEGDPGLSNFEELLSALGYSPHGFRYGSLIEVFLADNPGAVKAIIDWIGEQNLPEWQESLSDYEDAEDEE